MSTTLPRLTLYRIDGSCSLVAHITLHELGIPFTATRMIINPTTHKAEAADGTYSCEEYAQLIDPNGQVPALEVHPPSSSPPPLSSTPQSVVINENPAILLYLADLGALHKDKHLGGRNPLERAQIASWLAFLSTSVHGQAYGAFYRPRRYIDGGKYPKAEQAVREAGRRSIDLFYEQIEGRLPERIAEDGDGGEKEDERWVVGGQLSVVDFNLYLFYRWGKEMMGMKMEELYPRWTELVRGLEKRPSVKTAVWVENIRAVF